MSQFENKVYVCATIDGKLWMPDHSLPLIALQDVPFSYQYSAVIGEFNGIEVVGIWQSEQESCGELFGLRTLLGSAPAALFDLAGKAVQIEFMLKDQAFCGRCGRENKFSPAQLAMYCDVCERFSYPRVSPCVIVAVRKGDHILLAQHPRHKTGMYTVVAGFVEPGETLEQCVAREVAEETGLAVKNIRYFDSQPWAFPSNLMMGFLADYQKGEITPDYEELTDARWFHLDELPEIAPAGTIAHRLIHATKDNHLKKG